MGVTGVTAAGRRRWLRPALIVVAVAAVAAPKLGPELAGALGGSGSRDGAAAASRPPPRGAAPVRVSAVLVSAAPLAEVVATTGTLLAEEAIELQAETGGRIASIAFAEGTRVERGDLLVKLDDTELKARRAAAGIELALADKRERRAAELLAQGFVRADEYDAALNAVEMQRAQIALIEAQIAKTEIRAPFDGIAGLRHVSEGSVVGAATHIATLQQIDRLKVEFAVPEKYAARIEVGSPVSFTVAGQEQQFAGHVYARDPRVDPATRTLLLRALCPNPGGVLLPGSFANVRLTVTETADALLIPAAALIPDMDAAYVFVLGDGRAERRRVETGVRTDSRIQILAGLEPGDIVITSGLQQIRPESLVEAELVGVPALTDVAGTLRR